MSTILSQVIDILYNVLLYQCNSISQILGRIMRFLHVSLFCIFSYLVSFNASANLSLSVHRLFFDNSIKSNSLSIRNTANKPIKYSIKIIHQDMNENGILFSIDLQQVSERSAKKMLRYSPRRGVIQPQEVQAVRFRLRKPANLAAGEYRAVLKITSQIINDNKGAGIQIVPKLSYNIPIIVRNGKLQASSTLENPHLIMQNSQATIQLWQTLSGNRSLFGDFFVLDKNNNEVGRINGIGVYLPLTRRKVNIPLTPDAQGELTIHYQEQREYGGNIRAETAININ